MGRYIKDIKLRQPIDVVSMLLDDYIYHNRFKRSDWNGEMVYVMKDSHGRERYFEWHYTDGVVHIEAWLKSRFGKEQDLNGTGASRSEFRRSIEQLLQRLVSQNPATVSGGHIGSDPLHHDNYQQTNHEAWKSDTQWQKTANEKQVLQRGNSGQSTVKSNSFMWLVVAIIAGMFVPVLGVVFIVVALKKSKSALPAEQRIVKIIAMIAGIVIAVSFLMSMISNVFGLLFRFWI